MRVHHRVIHRRCCRCLPRGGQQIDLSPINAKLQYENRHSGATKRSSRPKPTTAISWRCICCTRWRRLVPNKILDEYWHQHILDTRKYAADCETTFGFFLHHDPYFGIEGEEDRQLNLEAFAVTQQIWEEAFGVPLLGESNPCSTTDCR